MTLNKIEQNIYEIPPEKIGKFQMKVPVHVYANKYILNKIQEDRTLDQIRNVACLKGIKKHAIALSDAHQGYGFCIGGVAATDIENGMISPGGVGYDINCGVRLLRTNLSADDLEPKIRELLDLVFQNIPSGIGSKGKLSLRKNEFNDLLNKGLNWAYDNGYATKKDLEHCEENGHMKDADDSFVSKKAKKRGINQVGSLGSGNHFLEIQRVSKIYNKQVAKKLGINRENQVTVMIHTGSRGFGHQVCTDSLRKIEKAMKKYDIKVPDRELACVPADTPEADEYLRQMACAANFGFCNRQLITYWLRESFERIFNRDFQELDMDLIYGVCHNILKKEEHDVNGDRLRLNVHRKGATRCFPPNHPEIPHDYQKIGQPALIPGTMGSASYLCVGRARAMELTFGSTAHGSGRLMSRRRADRKYSAKDIKEELWDRGILIKGASMRVIAEEAPGAYKDVDQVVDVSHKLGIVEKIARLVPLGVVKG
jgi:tRNA-splicing ligase RtcB